MVLLEKYNNDLFFYTCALKDYNKNQRFRQKQGCPLCPNPPTLAGNRILKLAYQNASVNVTSIMIMDLFALLMATFGATLWLLLCY